MQTISEEVLPGGDKLMYEASDIVMYSKDGKVTNFSIGDRVVTSKGSRFTKPTEGVIVGFSKWRTYAGAKVKKDNGQVKLYLFKNLTQLEVKNVIISTKYKTVNGQVCEGRLYKCGETFQAFEGKTVQEFKSVYPEARFIQLKPLTNS